METKLKENLERWIGLSKAIKSIYDQLILLEQQKLTNSKEYKTLIDLLPTAIRLENQAINDLDINKNNWQIIRDFIEEKVEGVYLDLIEGKTENLDTIRRSNKLEIILLKHDNFFEIKPTNNVIEAIEMLNYAETLNDLKYAHEFLRKMTINHLAIIEKTIKNSTDENVINELIRLKYETICITPPYENAYIYYGCTILPPININEFVYKINDDNIETIKDLNEFNLKENYFNDLVELLTFSNDIIDKTENIYQLYKLLTMIQARLISLDDITFVQNLYNKTLIRYPDNENYSKIIKIIDEMFDDTIEYLKTNIKKRKTKK